MKGLPVVDVNADLGLIKLRWFGVASFLALSDMRIYEVSDFFPFGFGFELRRYIGMTLSMLG